MSLSAIAAMPDFGSTLSLSLCSNNAKPPLPPPPSLPLLLDPDPTEHINLNSQSSSHPETLTDGDASDRSLRLPVNTDAAADGRAESESQLLKRTPDELNGVNEAAASDNGFQAECSFCHRSVSPGEEILCSVRGCDTCYHKDCAKEDVGVLNKKKFKCPQHVCFLCKQKLHLLRCVRCTMAFHHKCAPWPDEVVHLKDNPGHAVCWRHPSDWHIDRKLTGLLYLLDAQPEAPISDISEVIDRLPLPYINEEFKIDLAWKDMDSKLEPAPYVHIRRNIYLVKKKRSYADDGAGCTSCSSSCSDDCVCRVQCISCSKACRCSENCSNRPFRKEKKTKLVKTELCGWGVEAAEPINKGGFIIEYIGEVIDDALCEQRLWDMKDKNIHNFYMCEIRKDFTIDATFKGNTSRFLNHSCDPNCVLEKWQVDGETRVGVFAARSIEIGEPLTYDYRFVQFGPEVKCHCGAAKCQGFLGTKKKIGKVVELCWGSKRKRTSKVRVRVVTGA